MTISKTPSGRWRVRVKSGRAKVADRTFDLKRDAEAWQASQKRALDLGEYVDPRAGKELLGAALDRWHAGREGAIASSTFTNEGYALKHAQTLRSRPMSAVTTNDLNSLYTTMLRTLGRDTVVRFRQTLSAFFAWAVDHKVIAKNPVTASKVPTGTAQRERREIFPFTLEELRAVHARLVGTTTKANADIALVLGLTGLRWGELVSLRVRDVQQLPYPALRVSRSKPDGEPVRNITKGGKPRTVPLTDDAAAIILPLLTARKPDDLVFPSATGSFRSGNNWKRDAHWTQHGMGRRVQDLRHTAATLWLQSGVDLKTVQAWLGHSTAKLTADTYSHYMGSDADTAAIARMNAVLSAAPLRPPRTIKRQSR